MVKRKKAWLLAGTVLLVLAFLPGRGSAGVNVNIGIFAPPPPYVFNAPPSVVVIPGTYAYFVPGIDVDIFFYHGFWYRPYEGRWYRSRFYRGPWGYLVPSRVPRVLMNLPPDYRREPPRYRPVPYGQLRRNWNRWERDRYWDRHEERPERHERHEGHMGRGMHD